MNRLFLNLYSAVLLGIIGATAAATAILWVQWQPEHNYQLQRLTAKTLETIRDDLMRSTKNQTSPQLQLSDQRGLTLEYSVLELERLRKLSRELGGLLALVYVSDLQLSESEQKQLNAQEVVFRLDGHMRRSYLRYDDQRALEVELPTLKGCGNQWMIDLIFLLNQDGPFLEERLANIRSLLPEAEALQVTTLKEQSFQRIELSRLLVTPRASVNFIDTQHQVHFLHIPKQPYQKKASSSPRSSATTEEDDALSSPSQKSPLLTLWSPSHVTEPQIIEVNMTLSATRIPPSILLPLIALCVGVTLWIKLNPIARKACQLAQAAEQFGAGDLHARVNLSGGGPVEEIAHRFDQAADQILTLVNTQKGILDAVAHELRTPIARIYFLIDLLREESDPEEINELYRTIEVNLEELKSLTADLVNYQRYCQPDLGLQCNPHSISQFVRTLLRQQLDLPSTIHFQDHTSGDLLVASETKVLARALNNIIYNAAHYAQEQIKISLYTTLGEVKILGDGDWIELHIEDDGEGVPIELYDKIFDPFFRVDESRNRESGGVGLGLSIAQSIINALEGTIIVDASHLGGACFKVILPRHTQEV